MNNNELRASLLMEAADLLSESAGKNSALNRNWEYNSKHYGKEAAKAIAQGDARKAARYAAMGAQEADDNNNEFRKRVRDNKEYRRLNNGVAKDSINRTINNNANTVRWNEDTDKYGVRQDVRARKQAELKQNGLQHLSTTQYDPYYKSTRATKKRNKQLAKKYLRESIDLLYDKAALCESVEDTEYYINQALELSELL